jgi:hypothetical protein
MRAIATSPFFHRFLAGFSLGAIAMVTLNVDRLAATPIF